MSPILLLAFLVLSFAKADEACPSAEYDLTITPLFTSFPDYTSILHFSPLTAFSHAPRFSAFVLFGYATGGVQSVAESGDNAALLSELENGLVSDIATASAPVFQGESFSVSVKVNCTHPLVSAVSMVAPSPDWFIALSALDLRAPDGAFVPVAKGMLKVYDAGTDAGETLMAEDKVSDPIENIAPLEGMPFDGKPVAKFVLRRKPPAGCATAKYRLSVRNLWKEPQFENVPDMAVLSPLTAVSHSRRFSALTLFGYASDGVRAIAEDGDNSVMIEELGRDNAAPFVKMVAAADGSIIGGAVGNVTLMVDCQHTVVTALSMLAPSSDWIVAVANLDLMGEDGFVEKKMGGLMAYDAGTDSGDMLIADDVRTQPQENIAPLVGGPFGGRTVAKYILEKIEG